MIPATIDFETRSACSLRKSGAWRYSIDPTTQVLCFAFRFPYWPAGQTELWHPAFPALGIPEALCTDTLLELVAWIESDRLVEAHNASFERCIWHNIMVPHYGWPAIAIEQWRCSAARAAALALPRALKDASAALGLSLLKDDDGHKVMMKITKSRKSRKAERAVWEKAGTVPPMLLWHESRELFERVWTYCRQDVLAEEALSTTIPELSANETAVYTLDQTVNQRGFQLDRAAVGKALQLIASESTRLNAELRELTGGKVQKATQRAKMIEWLGTEGLELFDTQKDTIDRLLADTDALGREVPEGRCRRALELVRELGRSSTAKYQAMRDWMDPADARVRGGLLYHGATTGRWSGSGVQPHNFPRGTVKDQEVLWEALKSGREHGCGTLLTALSNGLRGTIVAAPGHMLYVADYASIEARILVWLADDPEALQMFREEADIYLDMASSIYGYPCRRKEHEAERQIGKIAILGLGYQMGASKFQATCEAGGSLITEEFALQVVTAYREKYWRVKQLWADTEQSALDALHRDNEGIPVPCGRVSWVLEGRFLYCELPSGRRIAYPDPRIQSQMTPWGKPRNQLTFMGTNAYSRKWERQHTYGGSLVENVVQATARDVMAEAMQRCEVSGYPVVLTVHDEIMSEAKTGNLKLFEGLVAQVPEWADGLPIAIDGFATTRYRK